MITLLFAEAAANAAPDYLPMQVGNQWVLESASTPAEILNIQILRSRVFHGVTYYETSGYTPGRAWIRSTEDGRVFSVDVTSGEETQLAHLRFGAPSYLTMLSGCQQVASPLAPMPPVAGGEESLGLPVNYDPGACRDNSIVSEIYRPGVGLSQRSITTFRGARDYRLVYAKVNGQVVGTRNRESVLHYDFDFGANGWRGGFSDYSLVTADTRTVSEIRRLPEEFGSDRYGFYLQSMNRSDDLFMFLKKVVTGADGLDTSAAYRVQVEITFLSNAPSGCVGAGGAPGEGVYLKAGASADEPVSVLRSGQHLEMNIDKGFQSTGGKDAGVVGNIANGLPCGAQENPPYVRLRRSYTHPDPVRTDERGELWLIVGTDSAYEGLTGLFSDKITVRLKPVEEE